MDNPNKRKYIAVKPKGFNHYIWFKWEDVKEDGIYFTGNSGWGSGGEMTDIKCRTNEIESVIYSNALQYT